MTSMDGSGNGGSGGSAHGSGESAGPMGMDAPGDITGIGSTGADMAGIGDVNGIDAAGGPPGIAPLGQASGEVPGSVTGGGLGGPDASCARTTVEPPSRVVRRRPVAAHDRRDIAHLEWTRSAPDEGCRAPRYVRCGPRVRAVAAISRVLRPRAARGWRPSGGRWSRLRPADHGGR